VDTSDQGMRTTRVHVRNRMKFRFLRSACLVNPKRSFGLMLVKTSDMRISLPLDLSSLSFIPQSRFIRSRRPTPLVTPSLVLRLLCKTYSINYWSCRRRQKTWFQVTRKKPKDLSPCESEFHFLWGCVCLRDCCLVVVYY
jgi:hypothetical protein